MRRSGVLHLIDTRSASLNSHYVNPHTWAIGGTFEFTFILPKPANAGNTLPPPFTALTAAMLTNRLSPQGPVQVWAADSQ